MNTPSQSRCEPVIRTLLALADDLHRQQVRLGASAAEAQLQQEYDFAEREAGRLSEQEQHLRAAVAALSERRPSDGPGLLATKQDMEARSAERLMFGCTNCGHINDQRLDNAIPSSVAPHEGYAWVDIVFDGPPDHDAPHFVEVESPPGTSIRFGQWVERDDGLWALRFKEALAPASASAPSVPAALLQEATSIALVISGHFCENPDEWLRGHEKRLRDLEKLARAASQARPDRRDA